MSKRDEVENEKEEEYCASPDVWNRITNQLSIRTTLDLSMTSKTMNKIVKIQLRIAFLKDCYGNECGADHYHHSCSAKCSREEVVTYLDITWGKHPHIVKCHDIASITTSYQNHNNEKLLKIDLCGFGIPINPCWNPGHYFYSPSNAKTIFIRRSKDLYYHHENMVDYVQFREIHAFLLFKSMYGQEKPSKQELSDMVKRSLTGKERFPIEDYHIYLSEDTLCTRSFFSMLLGYQLTEYYEGEPISLHYNSILFKFYTPEEIRDEPITPSSLIHVTENVKEKSFTIVDIDKKETLTCKQGEKRSIFQWIHRLYHH